MKIPYQDLSADALTAIIEEFITREGTDYGDHEYSLAQKVEQVMCQLGRGEIYVSFDPESQTCQLNTSDAEEIPVPPDDNGVDEEQV